MIDIPQTHAIIALTDSDKSVDEEEYMFFRMNREEMACVKEEGFEEGQDKILHLIQLLIKNSRNEEIEKAVNNQDFRNQLFNEFGL